MLFNSSIFAVFLAVLLPLYALLRASAHRKVLLLVASYLFYANWDWRYLSLLLISTAVDYHAGRRLARTDAPGARRAWLLASLVTNLGFLGVFKYGNFIIDLAAPLWTALGVEPIRFPGSIPVGISFYTFQTMSYTIDIYRRKAEPSRRLLDFALYVSFFAQLVAGPIVRSGEFLPQITAMKNLRMGNVSSGTQRFLLGLFKKVAIADNVALFVDNVFQAPQSHSALMLWGGAFGFTLQVYCDFSAYSDMAVGIGRAFNIKLPENFRNPYLARSITEFWQRWHISLSTWLRDYLYIPLGGSRKGPGRTYFNLLITMFLGGL
ncbi:MAG: MBOAT family protein, partial [Gemmatimonadetes bacterium]|nr:MBOAT family protein [Gemmatimonadota bacterium]